MSILKSVDSKQYLNLSHSNMMMQNNGSGNKGGNNQVMSSQTNVTEDTGRAVVSIVREVKQGGVLVFF